MLSQLLVAVVARRLEWPDVGAWALLRSFAFWDLALIGGFALLLALALRSGVAMRTTLALAWVASLLHGFALAANVIAIQWLSGPVTCQWLVLADMGRSETPRRALAAVLTPGAIAGLAGALLLPLALVGASAASQRARRWQGWPLALVGLGLLALAPPLLGRLRPPHADGWRDAISNPLLALARSCLTDATRRITALPGDGRTGDYAVRPAQAPRAGAPRPDLLVIVIESASARAIAQDRANLPTIGRLAAEGTSFTRAAVAVPFSSRSLFSLFFSRYPLLGVQAETGRTLAPLPGPFPRVLAAAGYRTVLLMSGDLAFESAGATLRTNGAGDLRDVSSIRCADRIRLTSARWRNNDYLPDRCVFAAAHDWFANRHGQPSAAVIWTGSTHFPYTVEGPAPADPQARYRLALRQADRQIGELLARLASEGIRPVVLVLGDHGETFGEHGFHVHGQTVFSEETGIPFILAGPGVPAGRRDDRLVQMVDVAPTLTALAGAGRPAGWQGLSVLDAAQRERDFAFAVNRTPMLSLREGDRTTVLDLASGNTFRYDLARDPGQQHPVPASPEDARRAEAALAGWVRYNRMLYSASGR